MLPYLDLGIFVVAENEYLSRRTIRRATFKVYHYTYHACPTTIRVRSNGRITHAEHSFFVFTWRFGLDNKVAFERPQH
jgi:hypothetical protein